MNRYIVDTHTLFWYLTASPRLGSRAKAAFDEGACGEAAVYIPAIVLAELFYLNEKRGRPIDFRAIYEELSGSGQMILLPLMPEDILDFETDASVPEMHDRIIVGVARRMDAICLSLDSQIVQSNLVTTIW